MQSALGNSGSVPEIVLCHVIISFPCNGLADYVSRLCGNVAVKEP